MLNINILCIGDVCGSTGREMLRRHLSKIKKEHGINLTIANGENSADGNGITIESATDLLNMGIDVITGGNHSFKRPEIKDFYEENAYVLRPHNISSCGFGSGYCLYDSGRTKVAVINLSGIIYLDKHGASDPFSAADELLNKAAQDGATITVADFHAEATSEKRALGIYLDGRVSVFFGTHTHVQTADNQILPNGTGYITDIGMTGPRQSVLGVKSSIIIDRLKNGSQDRFELDGGECMINGCVFETDEKSGKVLSVKRVYLD